MKRIALDKASVRSVDVDGRLHVALNNISKATVDPYYGHEIPNSEQLGLRDDKIYYLLRHPDELEKGAATFNNLPILSKHVPVNSDDHQPEIVIGSTGTDARFVTPYLQNSAVIWAQKSIDDINHETAKEWSCAYRYEAEMTKGTFQGLHYDGIMRNIVGNHVALVEEGRAGPDVVVGDSILEGPKMKYKTRSGLMLNGALLAAIGPKLALDKKLDLSPALADVTAASIALDAKRIATAVVAASRGKLAKDEGIDVADVVAIIETVQGSGGFPAEDDELEDDRAEDEEPDDDKAEDEDPDDDKAEDDEPGMAFLREKLSEDDMNEYQQLMAGGASDDDLNDTDDDDGKPVDKKAMDAKLKRVEGRTVARMNAIRVAEKAVYPHVGEVVAMDSAASIYRFALDTLGVDIKGVHPSAYPAMLRMVPASTGDKPIIAQDRKTASTDFADRFPEASKLVKA